MSCTIGVPLWPSKLQAQTTAETQGVPWGHKHRLHVTALYVPQRTAWNWGDERVRQDITPRRGIQTNELGLYDKALVFTSVSHTSFYFWPTVELVSQLPFVCLFESAWLAVICIGIYFQTREKHRGGVCTEILWLLSSDCSKRMYFLSPNYSAFYHIL